MPDGLYQVIYRFRNGDRLCAGFVIERGRAVLVAPCLVRRLAFWASIARRIGD